MTVQSVSTAEERVQALRWELHDRYPDLTVTVAQQEIIIRGTFTLLHEGQVLDRFQIEITWTDSDAEVPVLRETTGRIPWTLDRHMTRGGMACLFVPEEWLLRPRPERTLTNYLDGPVREYFLWQSLVERGESPPWPDRSHGADGLLEAYGDMVGLQNPTAIKTCLDYLARDIIKGHWSCPYCGKNRLRNCHIEKIRGLRAVLPQHIAKLALKRLEKPIVK